jgi:tetratricopeptide (TPR) repeat protein
MTSFHRTRAVARTAAASLVALTLGACSTIQQHELERQVPATEMQAYLADKPSELRRLYARVPIEGPRNATLNHMRAGLAALQTGEYEAAARSFDAALETIEAVYADNEKAKSARSLWIKENAKDFKGEPYERAMAYYYRGLLYMIAGDYENARASFRGGLLQSGFSYDQRFEAQFALLNFLEGWAGRCAGATARAADAFAEAVKLNAKLATPPEGHSVLFIGEVGRGPLKVADGKDREMLRFRRGPATGEDAVVFAAVPGEARPGQPALPLGASPTVEASDLYLQASSRGGRQMDGVLQGKAVFKDTTKVVGTIAVGAGAGLMNSTNSDAQMAGAIMAVGGLVAMAVSEATKADADVRAWDNLPATIWLATAEPKDAGLADDSAGAGSAKPVMRVLSSGAERRTVEVPLHRAGACSLGWARTFPATDIPDSAPGAVAQPGLQMTSKN